MDKIKKGDIVEFGEDSKVKVKIKKIKTGETVMSIDGMDFKVGTFEFHGQIIDVENIPDLLFEKD